MTETPPAPATESPENLNGVARVFDQLTTFSVRRYRTVLMTALILGALGGWGVAKLKINQKLTALMPEDSPSIVRADELGRRVGSQQEFIVELKGTDRDTIITFGKALATQLRQMSDAFQHVEFFNNTDTLKDSALLYVPVHKLMELRTKVIDRIQKEVKREVVENVEEGEEDTTAKPEKEGDDPLELNDEKLREEYGQKYDLPREYLETSEETPEGKRYIFVLRGRPEKPTSDLKFTRQLVRRVSKLIDEVQGQFPQSGLNVRIKGAYAERKDQVDGMKKDLLSSVAFAVGLLLLVLALHFKKVRAIPLILGPLILAILVTAGIATLLYPWLNVVTAFIFVALLGLGIDFGIHMVARYDYERLRGADQLTALRTASTNTGIDVAMGALTTATMFALFTVADFRGFSQFGVIAAIGVLLALTVNLTVLPALTVAVERRFPWKPRRWLNAEPSEQTTPAASKPRKTLAFTIVFVSLVLAALSLWKAPQIQFETDFRKLRHKKSGTTQKSKKPKDYRDAIGRPDFGPAMAMGAEADELRWLEDHLNGIKSLTDAQVATFAGRPLTIKERRDKPKEDDSKTEPASPPSADDPCAGPPTNDTNKAETNSDDDFEDDFEDDFDYPLDVEKCFFARLQKAIASDITPEARRVLALFAKQRERLITIRWYLHKHLSFWSFVPTRQQTKLWIIRDIRRRLDNKYDDLKPDTQKKVEDLRRYLKINKPLKTDDLPLWVRTKWRDSSGEFGRQALIWNRGSKINYADAKRLYQAFFDLPATRPSVLDANTLPNLAGAKRIEAVVKPYASQGPAVSAGILFHYLLAQGIEWSPAFVEVMKKHVPMPQASVLSDRCKTEQLFYSPWNLETCLAHLPKGWQLNTSGFVTDLRTSLQSGARTTTTIPTAAAYYTMPEVIDAIKRDGPRVLAVAMVAICLCLLVLFRRPWVVALVLVPLVAAIAWLAGVFWLLGWKLNMYNIITFALLIGMGVDDGIHVTSRWLEEGCRRVGIVVRETGAAITLTTVTTCIGFSGLLFSNHLGLSTLGWTAALGMVLTFVASVVTLPALLYLVQKAPPAHREGTA